MDKEEENKRTEKQHVNQETVDAIEEGHRLANDPNAPAFHDIKSLFEALDSRIEKTVPPLDNRKIRCILGV